MVYMNKLGIYSQDPIGIDDAGYSCLEKLFKQWRKNNSIKIDNKSLEILRYFIDKPTGSTYQCFNYMNKEKKIKISYKNVHKKISELYESNFIVKVKNSDYNDNRSKHGAIYYKLSHYSIFYFHCSQLMTNFLELHSGIIFNNENYLLYKNILYSHLQLQTLKELTSRHMFLSVLTYLHNIFTTIEKVFLHISKLSYVLDSIERIGGIISTSSFEAESLLEEYSYGLSRDVLHREEIKNVRSEVKLINWEKLLEIQTEGKTLYLKILQEENKLEIYDKVYSNSKLIFKIDINPEYDTLETLKDAYIPITIKKLIKLYLEGNYHFEMYDNIITFVLSMIGVNYSLFNSYEINAYSDPVIKDLDRVSNDLRTLKTDVNFLYTVFLLKHYIKMIYEGFEKFGKDEKK